MSPQPSAVEVWQGLCDPGRYALPRGSADPVAATLTPPAWWAGYLDEDGRADPDYVMAVAGNPDDRHWGSATAHVPLTLYRGSSTYPSRPGYPDSTALAAAEVSLIQDVDHREPFVHVGRRTYTRGTDSVERMDYRQVLDLRLSEAEDLAAVLTAAVRLARAALQP